MNSQILQNRLKKEIMNLDRDPPPGVTCYPKEDDLTNLEAFIKGPPDSPYENGLFKLNVKIPQNYPFDPPQIRFSTYIYHPNIDDSGRICANILKKGEKGGWNPALNLSTTLLLLSQLLAQPNPDDPLDAEIAKEYQFDHPAFKQKAVEFTAKYANKDQVLSNQDSQEIKETEPITSEEVSEDEKPEDSRKPKLSLSKKRSASQPSSTQITPKSSMVSDVPSTQPVQTQPQTQTQTQTQTLHKLTRDAVFMSNKEDIRLVSHQPSSSSSSSVIAESKPVELSTPPPCSSDISYDPDVFNELNKDLEKENNKVSGSPKSRKSGTILSKSRKKSLKTEGGQLKPNTKPLEDTNHIHKPISESFGNTKMEQKSKPASLDGKNTQLIPNSLPTQKTDMHITNKSNIQSRPSSVSTDELETQSKPSSISVDSSEDDGSSIVHPTVVIEEYQSPKVRRGLKREFDQALLQQQNVILLSDDEELPSADDVVFTLQLSKKKHRKKLSLQRRR